MSGIFNCSDKNFRQRLCRAGEGTCVSDISLQQLQLMSCTSSDDSLYLYQNLRKMSQSVSVLLSEHSVIERTQSAY